MAKKRSCRRTVNEDKVHEKAVKIRKMTDEQLVQYVNDRVEKARSEGFNQGKKSVTGITVNEFLKEISKIKGVGDATICKIMEHFREKGIKEEKTPLQIFEERNEKACCLNCEKLIVKHTKTGHINFCGESEKIILDMFLDTGTNFSGCKYARKEPDDDKNMVQGV